MKTEWQFYKKSDKTWDAMLSCLRKAQKSIDFEQFVFTDTKNKTITREFVDLFIQKAKNGVKVRVLIDALPNLIDLAKGIHAEMKNAGVEIIAFTATTYRWRWYFRNFFRDHRKLLIIDNKIAFIGGVINQEKARYWRDTHVKVTGPVVEKLKEVFNTSFLNLKVINNHKVIPPIHVDDFSIYSSGPQENEQFILSEIIRAFNTAEESIYLASYLFNPPSNLLKSLKKAEERGVEINIIIPADSENFLATLVTHSFLSFSLKNNFNIYLYPEYIHAKTAVVDQSWATVGSANFDSLSLLYNYELNLVSTNKEFTKESKEIFLEDIRNSKKLEKEKWKKAAWYWKLLVRLSKIFRKIV